ncbi:MAG: ATP-binding protein [Ignavibacteriaceae bacterium]
MKRIDYWRRLYFARVRAKRERRLGKRRLQEHKRRAERRHPNVLPAPLVFDIDTPNARSRLLSFLATLRTRVIANGGNSVTIDFSDTRKMWASGTLLFKAELYRLQRITGGKTRLGCISPRNSKVSQVLKKTGIFKLLRHRSKEVPSYADVIHWYHAHGNQVDGTKYDNVLGRYDGVIPDVVANGLYLGLTEAMTNCHHHAYIEQRQDGLNQVDEPQDWWMFSQERDGRLTVVFCDLGVGIPQTLPLKQPDWWERMKMRMGSPTDAQAIDEAIKESHSRTKKHYRGKGLGQMVRVIERTPKAVLFLHSNRGRYVYRNGNSDIQNFGDSILGTLIAWSVPVQRSEPTYAQNNQSSE